MKKTIIILSFLYSFIGYSQTNNQLNSIQLSNPNPKNELSKYFKKKISSKLLKKVRYSKSSSSILLYFYLNNQNKPFGIKTNSYINPELRKEITNAFQEYPIEKLNLGELDKKKEYYLQIISKRGNKNVFSCSTEILHRTLPEFDSCKDLNFYKDIETCIKRKIDKHFYNYIHFSLANRFEDKKYFNIKIDLATNEFGNLYIKKAIAPRIFLNGIKNAVDSFPAFKIPSLANGTKTLHNYTFNVKFKKGDAPKYREPDNYDSIFKTNSINNFAEFLSKKIDKETLKSANLNRIKNRVILSFELDKKNKPFNIKTTSRSSFLNEKIITLFKQYPIDKLNFSNKSSFNNYILQILSFEDNKVVIKTNPVVVYERIPVFPGCEESKNSKEAKNCFNKGIQLHFMKKFDTSIPKKLKLSPGRKRIFISFKVNTEGKITDIITRAPHPDIENEVISVMKTLPKIQPGIQIGRPVNVKYNIPFTILVK